MSNEYAIVFYNMKIAANPRNAIKPMISVMVVKTTVEARAGSWFSLSSRIGIIEPKKPAVIRFIIIAIPITIPREVSSNHIAVIPPAIKAKATPLSRPTMLSFPIILNAFVSDISLVAMARTATVKACVPAFPPIDATIGIRIARATTCSIVPSNTEITIDARIAVNKFTNNQLNLERVVDKTAL